MPKTPRFCQGNLIEIFRVSKGPRATQQKAMLELLLAIDSGKVLSKGKPRIPAGYDVSNTYRFRKTERPSAKRNTGCPQNGNDCAVWLMIVRIHHSARWPTFWMRIHQEQHDRRKPIGIEPSRKLAGVYTTFTIWWHKTK